MSCSGSFASSYHFWAMLSGLFVGFSISRFLRFPASKDLKARHRKWIMFSFYLSAGVILALCAAFVPSLVCALSRRVRVSAAFLDYRLLYSAAGAAIAGFMGLRFKKAVGLPLLLIVAIGAGAVPALRHPWRRVEAGTPVAELRLLAITNGMRSIEFTSRDGDTYFFEISGNGITVEAEVLRTSDYYFFIDRPEMYRLKRVSDARGDDGIHLFTKDPDDAGGRFREWLQSLAREFPGWYVEPLLATTERLLPLFRYSVYLGGEEGAVIKLEQPKR